MKITYDGKNYTLTGDAYIISNEQFRAPAIDDQGREYLIDWDICNPDAIEQCECCDWNSPTEIRLFA